MNDVKIKYYKKLGSFLCIIAGAGLLLEHLFAWGGFDLLDFQGHEWYGIILVIAGFILSGRLSKGKELK